MKKEAKRNTKQKSSLFKLPKVKLSRALLFPAIFLLCILIYLFGAKVRFDIAMAQGKLSKAEKILPRINGYTGFYPSCAELVYEYALIGNYEAANNVYDNIMNDEYRYAKLWIDLELMEDLHYRNREKLTNKMYKYLMSKEEYDVAWHYYPGKGSDDNSQWSDNKYFSHISNVMKDLCSKGRKSEAQTYLNRSAAWFKINVKDDNSRYSYDNAKAELQEILNML